MNFLSSAKGFANTELLRRKLWQCKIKALPPSHSCPKWLSINSYSPNIYSYLQDKFRFILNAELLQHSCSSYSGHPILSKAIFYNHKHCSNFSLFYPSIFFYPILPLFYLKHLLAVSCHLSNLSYLPAILVFIMSSFYFLSLSLPS